MLAGANGAAPLYFVLLTLVNATDEFGFASTLPLLNTLAALPPFPIQNKLNHGSD